MSLRRRIALVFAIAALVLAATVAVLYAVENWRGQRAWAACQRDLQARGESLDAAAFIPPMIPDDQNLAMAPMFVRMFGYRVHPETHELTFPLPLPDDKARDAIGAMPAGQYHFRANETKTPQPGGNWSVGRSVDLAMWQTYYRQRSDFPHADQPQTPAEDVLLGLTKFAPILDELTREAAARPLTRFPTNWNDPQPSRIVLPQFSPLQRLTDTLRLRATANLALGHDDAAMRDLTLAQRLIQVSEDDPFLIAQLVAQTQIQIITQPVWEGLKARRWTGEELEQLKNWLRGLDCLAGYRRSMQCERAVFLCRTMDYYKAHGGTLSLVNAVISMGGSYQPSAWERFCGFLFDQIPGGWYDQNKALGCRVIQSNILDTFDAKAHRAYPAKVETGIQATGQLALSPYSLMVKMAVPVYNSILIKAAATQADLDHAAVACALEQFYLDRHAYPGRLDELVPAFLDRVPTDVIDGAPTRYRVTPDGRYALWSVGWNTRDDGGQTVLQKEGRRRDNNQGDWVWQYDEIPGPSAH